MSLMPNQKRNRSHLQAKHGNASVIIDFRLQLEQSGALGGASLLVDIGCITAVGSIAATRWQCALLVGQIILRPIQTAATEEIVYWMHSILIHRLLVKQASDPIIELAQQLLLHGRVGAEVCGQEGNYQNGADYVLRKREKTC